MSFVLKFLSRYQTNNIVKRYLRQNSRIVNIVDDRGNYNDGKTKKNITSIVSNDIILSSLKSVNSTKSVLDMVRLHGQIMTHKHLMQALRSLFMLQKSASSNLSMQQIVKHKDFEFLCKQLKKKAGTIELNEAIEALKILGFVGVSSDSTISQVLLNLLKHQLNDFSLHQIIFFHFLLSQMQRAPLVDALKLALPIIFQIHLPIKMDSSNIVYMTEFLQFLSKQDVPVHSTKYLVNSIMNYKDDIDVVHAKSILWSLCDFEANDFYEPLLKRVLNILTLNIDALTPMDVEILISKLCSRSSRRYEFYYNQIFFDVCANYAIERNMNFQYVIGLLRKFGKVAHVNKNLLDYSCKLINEDPEIFKKSDLNEIYTFILSISLIDYRPAHWDTIKGLIEKTNLFKTKLEWDVLWLKLSVSLFALDIFKPEVLENSLNISYLEKILKKGLSGDYQNLLLIKQLITLFKPDYMKLLPTELYFNEICSKLNTYNEYPLQGALHVALGGDNYVKTGVTTELQQHIDHLIVMRRGCYPVAFTTTSYTLEDIEIDPDNQMVVVLGLGSNSYPINSRSLKATTSLLIKTLEAKNCLVVPICLAEWFALVDFERIPYLMQAIKSKVQEKEAISNLI